MIQLVYSPTWFYGKDIIIDIVSVLVLFLIGTVSIKFYKMNKKKKEYFWLGTSFIIIAVSFIFKVLTNFTIYYPVTFSRKVGLLTLTYHGFEANDVLFDFGFLIYRILTLVGLFILFEVYQKNRSKRYIFLALYLIITSTYFSRATYFVFHLTALILLLIITIQYGRQYNENKHKTTFMLALGFGVISLSQLIFVFNAMHKLMYVAAEVVQLIGYLILFFTLILVLGYGKKKK